MPRKKYSNDPIKRKEYDTEAIRKALKSNNTGGANGISVWDNSLMS